MAGLNVTTSGGGFALTGTTDNPVVIATGVSITNPAGDGIDSSVTGIDWSLTNAGTILATGTIGSGVAFASGASITNTGVVAGYTAGVMLQGAGSVLNQGRIASDATRLAPFAYTAPSGGAPGRLSPVSGAVVLAGGGSVTNTAGAMIAGDAGGVGISGGSGAVSNAGSITAQGTSSIGVMLGAGGTVTNAQGAVISAGAYGFLSATEAATLDNTGRVQSSGQAGALMVAGGSLDNAAGGMIAGGRYGVEIGGSGTITNAGSIGALLNAGVWLLGADSLNNSALARISGAYWGVEQSSGLGGITNTGSILGGKAGVWLRSGAPLNNGAGGSITGGSDGVYGASGVGATIVNAGTIVGSGFSGVLLRGGGTITNQARAVVQGGADGVVLYGSGTSTLVNDGDIQAGNGSTTGTAVRLETAASVYNGAGGLISGGAGGIIGYQQTTLTNLGTISATGTGGSGFAFQAHDAGFADRVIVAPGAVFDGMVSGGNTIGATVVSTLELAAGSGFGGSALSGSGFGVGTITGLGTQFVDFGQIQVDAGADWQSGGTIVAGQTIDFAGGDATLSLLDPAAVAGTIAGFQASDTLVLSGIGDTTSVFFTGDTMVARQSAGPDISLRFAAPLTLNASVTGGSTVLTLACFAAGTRIRTPSGAVPVEALRRGMVVETRFSGEAAITWAGHRHVRCADHPRPRAVWPILIQAHAFGPGQPATDLRVSPAHAIFTHDVLVPARFLVNGDTIRQVPVEAITYHHIELPRHDVVFAEGLATESYLDTDGRANFEDGDTVRLFADFLSDPAELWEARGCAPLIVHGPILETIRAAIGRAARAA